MEKIIDFRTGSLGQEPLLEEVLAKAIASIKPKDLLSYGDPRGSISLRSLIASLHGGIPSQDQVLVTSSNQQGLALVFQELRETARWWFVPQPVYAGVNCLLRPIREVVGPYNSIDDLLARFPSAPQDSVVYVNSNFGNPSGISLTREERDRLTGWAVKNHALIVEDDPYDLLYFGEERPPTLQASLPGQTIHISGFSKLLAPGLRVGYILAPEELTRRLKARKVALDLFTSTASQRMVETALARSDWLSGIRGAYKMKRDAAVRSLASYCGDLGVSWSTPEGGISLDVRLDPTIDMSRLHDASRQAYGLFLEDDTPFFLDQKTRNTTRLNFVHNPAEVTSQGIELLARAIQEVRPGLTNNKNRRTPDCFEVITPSPDAWAESTDIIDYSIRQARSCVYLEKVFSFIKRWGPDRSVCGVLDALLENHRRQFRDLEEVMPIPRDDDRVSHYFEAMYRRMGHLPPSKWDSPMVADGLDEITILAIQGVSYLRGKDRYRLLKERDDPQRPELKGVYARFYEDAGANARRVFEYMFSAYHKETAAAAIQAALQAEDIVMKSVWRRNHVTP